AVFGKGRRGMRMSRAGVALLPCLLTVATLGEAQTPPATPPPATPTPAPAPAPSTPAPAPATPMPAPAPAPATTTQTPATPPAILEPADNSTMGGSLSQIIFDFGKTFASTEAARRLAEQAQEDVELQRQLVTQTVKESFTNINFAQRLIRVQEQAVERAQLNLRSAKGFFEVGTRPKSDVARAEVDVANARVDLIRARNAERLARVALATAMGLPATTPLTIQDNLVYQPVPLDRARLGEDALRMRPEYRQARLNADV